MREELNAITEGIIAAAIDVHHEIGPGALESTYESCIAFELTDRGLSFERQKALPIVYKGRKLEAGYRVDLLVEDRVVVEVKCIERFNAVHTAQLISYLRLLNLRVGLLLNFHVKWFVDGGIKRVANAFPD